MDANATLLDPKNPNKNQSLRYAQAAKRIEGRHLRKLSEDVTTGGKVYRIGRPGGPVTSARGGSGARLMMAELGTERAESARRRNGPPLGEDSSLVRRSRDSTGDTG